MSPLEKRRALRRAISYPALIHIGDGSPAREATLCDASQDGAQIVVADPDSLPDDFVLALSADGAARRHCHVVWRSGNQIGVEFLKPQKPAPRPAAFMRHTLPDPTCIDTTECHDDGDTDPLVIATLPPR
jgi:hypothetical protein